MKKILFLLSCIFLVGCNPKCILSQIPNQVVYADRTCTAQLPDYFKIFIPSDNCKIFDQVQDPPAGTILTADNPIITVRLFIIDGGTNTNSMSFTVYYLDTIKPQFITNPALLSQNWKIVDKLYNVADAFLKEIAMADQALPPYAIAPLYDSIFIPTLVGNSYITNLKRVYYTEDNISWLVDKDGHGSWITTADGVFMPDTVNKSVEIKVVRGRRIFTFIDK